MSRAMTMPCAHLDTVREVVPDTPDGCEECLSFEPGEDWGWCYVAGLYIEPAPEAS